MKTTPREILALLHDWHVWARDTQLPPLTTAAGRPWRTWLFLGGRGAGKTRAGAEWVRSRKLIRRMAAPGSPRRVSRRRLRQHSSKAHCSASAPPSNTSAP